MVLNNYETIDKYLNSVKNKYFFIWVLKYVMFMSL